MMIDDHRQHLVAPTATYDPLIRFSTKLKIRRLRTSLHIKLMSMVEEEYLRGFIGRPFHGQTYSHGTKMQIQLPNGERPDILLHRYVRESNLPSHNESLSNMDDALLNTITTCTALCARYMWREAVNEAIFFDVMAEDTCMAFLSMPLGLDETEGVIIEKDGWYISIGIERVKWDAKLTVGTLVGMIPYRN